ESSAADAVTAAAAGTAEPLQRKYHGLEHFRMTFDAPVNWGTVTDHKDGRLQILFPLEKIYMVWQQQQSAGAGLFNVGNTCFLNAVLQCLTYTPPLANYLLSREHSKQGFCMMCTMEAHVNKVLHSPVSAIVPWAVLKVFGREHFQLGMQEDAHDFLCCTVNAMQRACLSASSDLDLSSESTTIVHQIFGGFLRSRGAFPQLLLSLTLPVPFCLPIGCISALGCLCLFSRCTENVAASKRFTIHCAPKVLTVCLKRFDCFTGGKINKAVEYPEFLDLRPYMSEGDGEPLYYSLYAVLVHSGYSCHEGHYFCYTKASNGLWYQMDDESVEVRSIDTALGQQAYLLFYSSRPGWMGLGGSRSIRDSSAFLSPHLTLCTTELRVAQDSGGVTEGKAYSPVIPHSWRSPEPECKDHRRASRSSGAVQRHFRALQHQLPAGSCVQGCSGAIPTEAEGAEKLPTAGL
uniref:Ubiquitin carboxyl-terminal hydrolase n=1 Tax=Cyanistes caeruleus TaxID=156563 RepID=A0A8C0U3N3_CYACU